MDLAVRVLAELAGAWTTVQLSTPWQNWLGRGQQCGCPRLGRIGWGVDDSEACATVWSYVSDGYRNVTLWNLSHYKRFAHVRLFGSIFQMATGATIQNLPQREALKPVILQAFRTRATVWICFWGGDTRGTPEQPESMCLVVTAT